MGLLGEIRSKDVVMKELKEFIENIRGVINQEGLELTKNVVLQYAIDLTKIHMKVSFLPSSV